MNKEELRKLDIESINVKLPVILGVKPRVYITAVYALIIVLVLFFLLLFPGLRRNGTNISFYSSVPGGAVFIDNIYSGSTPGKIFVEKGRRELIVKRPFFDDEIREINVKGKLFFSLFFPRNQVIFIDLKINDAGTLFNAGLKETAEWALIDLAAEKYQPRPVISQTTTELVNSGNTELALSFVNETLIHITNKYLFKDWLKAYAIANSGAYLSGAAVSPAALPAFLSMIEDYPGLAYIFSAISTNSGQRSKLASMNFFKNYESLIKQTPDIKPPVPTQKISIKGITFLKMEKGALNSGYPADNMGEDFTGTSSHPITLAIDEYYIMDRETTKEMYNSFIEANPDWQASNIKNLMSEGKTDRNYLAGWNEAEANSPADYVSWFAAKAYCEYLNAFLPDYLKSLGYRVDLPSEAEWEYAALSGSNKNPVFKDLGAEMSESANDRGPDSSGIYDLYGNLWEWCREWFAPSSRFYADSEGRLQAQGLFGSEKSVRGGSWANVSIDISPADRGCQFPDWATPYLGFRAVITRAE